MKVELQCNVDAANETCANTLRNVFINHNVLVINVMSSSGAGKSSIINKTIEFLSEKYKVGIIYGNLQSSIDEEVVRECGALAVRLNTKKTKHLNAEMILNVLPYFDFELLDILFIENITSTSPYNLGENHKITVWSVPEGNQKVSRNENEFKKNDLVLLNKIDLLPYTSFDKRKALKDLNKINPQLAVIEISATTGEGFDEWIDWITIKRKELVSL